MIRGTTPTYTILLSDTDNIADVCFAIEQESTGVKVIKHSSEDDSVVITDTKAVCTLTQEDTLSFTASTSNPKTQLIKQVRVVYKDGSVWETDVDAVEREEVGKSIHDEVHNV